MFPLRSGMEREHLAGARAGPSGARQLGGRERLVHARHRQDRRRGHALGLLDRDPPVPQRSQVQVELGLIMVCHPARRARLAVPCLEGPVHDGVHDRRVEAARRRAGMESREDFGQRRHAVIRGEHDDRVGEPHRPVEKSEQPGERPVQPDRHVHDLVTVRAVRVPHPVIRREADAEQIGDRVASEPFGGHGSHGQVGQDVVPERRDVERVHEAFAERVAAGHQMGERATQAGLVALRRHVVRPDGLVGRGRQQMLPLLAEILGDVAGRVELANPRG